MRGRDLGERPLIARGIPGAFKSAHYDRSNCSARPFCPPDRAVPGPFFSRLIRSRVLPLIRVTSLKRWDRSLRAKITARL